MRKVVAISLGCFLGLIGSLRAETPDGERARFTFKEIAEGMLRLDNRTGEVSLCSKRAAGWACEAVPDDRAALETEIARLQGENAKLKRELISHGLSLPGGLKGDAHSERSGEPKAAGEADFDRVMAFLDRMWRRLIDWMQNLQRDRDWERKDMHGGNAQQMTGPVVAHRTPPRI